MRFPAMFLNDPTGRRALMSALVLGAVGAVTLGAAVVVPYARMTGWLNCPAEPVKRKDCFMTYLTYLERATAAGVTVEAYTARQNEKSNRPFVGIPGPKPPPVNIVDWWQTQRQE